MKIWTDMCANVLCQCHCSQSVPWLGVHSPWSFSCSSLGVPGDCGTNSNHCNGRGLFIMFEIKCSTQSLSRLQESEEHCAPIPVPGAVCVLEMHTPSRAPGNGASLRDWDWELCCWQGGLWTSFRQLQPTASREEGLPELTCRLWQRWAVSPATCTIRGMAEIRNQDKCQPTPARHSRFCGELLLCTKKIRERREAHCHLQELPN